MFNISKLIAAAATALALVACGGGGSSPTPAVQVASANLTVPVTAANADAFANIPFTFPKGVPDFGTTGTTTLTITNTATTPAFRIDTPDETVIGVMTFGSCIFNITSVELKSNFSGFKSSFVAGRTIEISDCKASLQVFGQAANEQSFEGRTRFILSGVPADGLINSVYSIGTDGTIRTPKGTIVGKVTLAFVTGT
jgi:hypothetical protein